MTDEFRRISQRAGAGPRQEGEVELSPPLPSPVRALRTPTVFDWDLSTANTNRVKLAAFVRQQVLRTCFVSDRKGWTA